MEGIFPRIESVEFSGMGTDLGVLIVVQDEHEVRQTSIDLALAQEEYVRLEKVFSRFDAASELSYFNSHLHESLPASADFLNVSKQVLMWYVTTGGLFDPRIIDTLERIGYVRDFKLQDFTPVDVGATHSITDPLEQDLQITGDKIRFAKRMDFSGIVKGYTTDQVALRLRQAGWQNFLVDSGGDMYMAGSPPEHGGWRIAIDGIDERVMRFVVSNVAVATSGISRRKWEQGGKQFHHLIRPDDPETYHFDMQTVTIVAESTEAADVLAKVVFIQSDEERRHFVREHQIAAVLLYTSGKTWVSPRAQAFLQYL